MLICFIFWHLKLVTGLAYTSQHIQYTYPYTHWLRWIIHVLLQLSRNDTVFLYEKNVHKHDCLILFRFIYIFLYVLKYCPESININLIMSDWNIYLGSRHIIPELPRLHWICFENIQSTASYVLFIKVIVKFYFQPEKSFVRLGCQLCYWQKTSFPFYSKLSSFMGKPSPWANEWMPKSNKRNLQRCQEMGNRLDKGHPCRWDVFLYMG